MEKRAVFISLGSNLGNRIESLKKAIHSIDAQLGEIFKVSSIYETTPWGKSNQPDFLNQVVLIHSDKSPTVCLDILTSIELQMGRKREEKWGARIIDLDLLYVDDEIYQSATLTLPHAGIPLRRFVLVPLVEIAPDFIHPQLKKNQRQLLAECPDKLEVAILKT
jgi:2-amino-4-hydroxy-6-hydroxymethyldihydropteridine diphosphokinase